MDISKPMMLKYYRGEPTQCPNCDCIVSIYDNYCSKCGQKFDKDYVTISDADAKDVIKARIKIYEDDDENQHIVSALKLALMKFDEADSWEKELKRYKESQSKSYSGYQGGY